MTNTTKQEFQPEMNKPVWIQSKKTKGIVKAIHESEAKTKVTFFDPKTNAKERKTVWFWNANLAPFDSTKRIKKQKVEKTKVEEVIEGSKKFNQELKASGLFTLVEPSGYVIDAENYKEFVKFMEAKQKPKDTIEFPIDLNNSKNAEEIVRAVGKVKKIMSEYEGGIQPYIRLVHSPNTNKTSFEQVREFQKAFELPAPDAPTILTEEQVINRSSWLIEEIVELLWATADDKDQYTNMYVELTSRMHQSYIKLLDKPFEPENKLVNQIDANIDKKYFVDGDLVEQGIIPDPITEIVHAANMAKLHDGKVVRNEYGKVQKPDGWEAPEKKIEQEVKRQVQLGAKRFK